MAPSIRHHSNKFFSFLRKLILIKFQSVDCIQMKYLFMQEYILWEIRVENVTCKNYSMHFHRKIYTLANSQIYLCNPFIVKKRVMWCCKLYLAVWKVICTCTLILVFFPDMYTYSLCMIIEEVSVTVSVSPVLALFYNNRKYEFVNQ